MIDDLTIIDGWTEEEEEQEEPDPLAPFLAEGLITEVLGELKSGKEGTVYCCRATPATGYTLLAAKVYRAREHRTFRNDAMYRAGTVILNGHDRRAVKKKTSWGREFQQGSWMFGEYATLSLLSEAGADVPAPVRLTGNAMLMTFAGDEAGAAPALYEVRLSADEARPLFERILANIELFLRLDRIHGDLSPYNILLHRGEPVIIDFPQAVDARQNPHALDLLSRDLENVCRYFMRCGIQADAARITRYLWGRYLRAEL